MAKRLKMAGDHVLLLDLPHETTLDGITLPDNEKQQEMQFGKVVAVGPLALETKEYDIVMIGPYAGKFAIVDGVQFRIVKQGQIESYVVEVAEA